MREDLLALELDSALALLKREGIEPQVTITRAPRRSDGGTLRVVYASDDARQLTAAGFFDPAADSMQEIV